MIGRLSSRQAFARLQTEGTRSGRGPLRLVSCVDSAEIPRIAFAIPRSVGNAVVRNRTKRRIRAVLNELDRSDGLVGGDHLIRVTAPIDGWDHPKLVSAMRALLVSPSSSSFAAPGQR